jgi:hypothetical protein
MKLAVAAIIALSILCFAELCFIVWQGGTISGLKKKNTFCEAKVLLLSLE